MLNYHALQAPQAQAGLLLAPTGWRECLAQNLAHFVHSPLAAHRQAVQQEVWALAQAYLCEKGEALPKHQAGPWLVTGHQPELFHPGVWVKNFTTHAIAQAVQGVALHLLVDNDTVKATSLALPLNRSATSTKLGVQKIPFDLSASELPYEERAVLDEALFASLPQRCTQAWPFRPLLPEVWERMQQSPARTCRLAERFAWVRRQFERSWGCVNLELPVSRLAQTQGFLSFLAELCCDAAHFREVHNAELSRYKQRYQMRSRHHPVPSLGLADGWYETPVWHWTSLSPRRQSVWVKPSSAEVQVRVGARCLGSLRLGSAPEQLHAWAQQGEKFRPKALTLTLFCRLLLADLFVHGLGGGKYDELTDAIIERYYACPPPAYLVMTGTLRLPFSAQGHLAAELSLAKYRLRDLRWNPQRHLPSPAGEELQHWAEARAELLASSQTGPTGGRAKHEQIRAWTDRLAQALATQRTQAAREVSLAERNLAFAESEQRRDYAWCLHPFETLQSFLESGMRLVREP